MPPLSEAAESGTGQLPLFRIHGDQFNTSAGDESVKITQSFGTVSRFDDNRALDKTRDGHPNRVGSLDRLKTTATLGFPLQDCQNRGCVDDHQRGTPASSSPRISSARLPSSTGKLAPCSAISSSSSARRRFVRSRRTRTSRSRSAFVTGRPPTYFESAT
jgi:hypothetical protein